MDEHINMLGKIKSREDFIKFMQLFCSAENDASIRYYLEALAGWAEDMDGYYRNAGKEMPANINWDFIATLLYAGSIYE